MHDTVATCVCDFLRELQERSTAEFLQLCEEAAEARAQECEQAEPEKPEEELWPWQPQESSFLQLATPAPLTAQQIQARPARARGMTFAKFTSAFGVVPAGTQMLQANPMRRAFWIVNNGFSVTGSPSQADAAGGVGWTLSATGVKMVWTEEELGEVIHMAWYFSNSIPTSCEMGIYEEIYLA